METETGEVFAKAYCQRIGINGSFMEYKNPIKKREKEVEQYSERLKFLKGSKELYLKAVDVLYQESIGVLQDTLDTALQYVMNDKDYSIKLELEDKRGTKSLNLALLDNTKGFEVDLKDGVGNGIRAIISFVLKAYYLVNENSRVLLLDEKYSQISAQYVPYFMTFLKKEICSSFNTSIIPLSILS